MADTVDGGFPDAEPSRDLGLGKTLEKPASDKRFLGAVEFAGASRRKEVLQSVEAILLVASFPAALGSNGVAKGTSQFLLGGEFALPKHNGDVAEVWQVVESEPINGVVATEDNAIPGTIDKPQTWVEESA